MIGSASFSEDRRRRFDLVRDWRDEPNAPFKTVLFAMLNPSKAGEKDNDPTVRKMVGFARRWGFGRAVAVNLNPIVSTDPWGLPYWNVLDMKNQAVIQNWIAESDIVVAAWGTQPREIQRKIALPELIHAFRCLAPAELYCIGTTCGGDPLHPSRAAYTVRPVRWR